MTSTVRIITCECGWSRAVARTVRRERRLQILADHQNNQGHGTHRGQSEGKTHD